MPNRHQTSIRRALAATSLAVLAALLGVSCSEDPPTSPTRHSLSGHVRLVGHLVNASGGFAGTRVVEDASGVVVELLYGPTVVARTTTVNGVYAFPDLGPGAYQARTFVVDGVADQTGNVTISAADVVAAHTLTLESVGHLLPIPNPSVDTVRVFFDNPQDQFVDIRVRDVGGETTRVLISENVHAGYKVALWTWLDGTGTPVTQPFYWVTFEAGADKRAHLLFR